MQSMKLKKISVNSLINTVASSFEGFLNTCAASTKDTQRTEAFRYGSISCKCTSGVRSNLYNWVFSDEDGKDFYALQQKMPKEVAHRVSESSRINAKLKKLAAHLIIHHLSSKAAGGYRFIQESGKGERQGTFVLNEANKETLQFVGDLYSKAIHAEASGNATQVECLVAVSLEEQYTEENFATSFFVGFPISKLPGSETIMEEILSNWPYFELVNPNKDSHTVHMFRDYFTVADNRDCLFHEIVSEASRYPLIQSLIGSRNYKQARDLLRVLTKVQFTIGTGLQKGRVVASKPMVSPPWQEISNKILNPIKKCIRTQNYTSQDYILALGKAASIAGKNESTHTFSTLDPELQESYYKFHQNKGKSIQGYISDAIMNSHIVETDIPNTYRFANKLFRLYFDAMASALKDSRRWAGGREYECVQTGISRMMNVPGTHWEKQQNFHSFVAEQAFSAETFYALTYLEYVDNSHRRILIRKLIQFALDFTVRDGNRNQQEKAISILCYVLIEKGHEFTSEERQEIFEAAFGRTLYKFQGILWVALQDQSAYYKRYANDIFQASFAASRKPSLLETYKGKPLFFFLAPRLFDNDFEVNKQRHPVFYEFIENIGFYRKTWYLSEKDELTEKDVLDALEKVVRFKLNEKTIEDFWKYSAQKDNEENGYLSIYGLNAVLYGLSNIKNHLVQTQRKKQANIYVSPVEEKQYQLLGVFVEGIKKWISQSQNAVNVYQSLILCDFNNRKYAKNYESFSEDYFLLAGPVRFICAYYQELKECIDHPISLGSEEAKKYTSWLIFQMKKDSRYGFLLSKLLSFSDFDLGPFVSRCLFADTSFLPYDNIEDNYSDFSKNCLFRWDSSSFSQ